MKRILLAAVLSFTLCIYASAQIICIYCYHQNDSISKGVHSLILNGGFETGTCPSYPPVVTFCPNSSNTKCTLTNWTCTGGGASTYACIAGSTSTFTYIAEGKQAAYFGNSYCKACSSTVNDTSCLVNVDCTVTGIPAGYPSNTAAYGGTNGVSLEQTVNGLVVGSVYVLEFWTGGEAGGFLNNGLFAVDVGFGKTMLRCVPTLLNTGIGIRYVIEFRATSTSHTIRFTNWGHICGSCTELVLDDVRLFPLSEVSPTIPSCVAGTPPVSAFVSSDSTFCNEGGQCIDFTDQSTGSPTSWKWSFPGAVPDTSTAQNPTSICYYTPGTYPVTLIVSNANGSDTMNVSPMITFGSGAAVPVITLKNDTFFCSHESSYQWYYNGVSISGATDSFYVATLDGTYNVYITDGIGCSRLGNAVVFTSSNEVLGTGRIGIYPNPVRGELVISSQSSSAYSIDIYNFLGEKIRTLNSEIVNRQSKIFIDVSSLPPGIYIVEVKDSVGVNRAKFIKE